MDIPNIAAPGPGGVLVDSINALNAMKKAQHEQEYAGLKNQYAPLTIPAQALSQLAYSQSVIPQYQAKALANQRITANLSPQAAKNFLNNMSQYGQGQGTVGWANGLQMPQRKESMATQLQNALLDKLGLGGNRQKQNQNSLNQLFNSQASQSNAQYDPNDITANSETIAPGEDPNEYVSNNNVNSPNYVGNRVQEEPGVTHNPPGTASPLTDEDLNQVPASMLKELRAKGNPETKRRIDEYLKGDQNSNQPAPEVEEDDFNTKAAKSAAAETELKEIAKDRAKAREEWGTQLQGIQEAEAPLQHMKDIINNPIFQNLRKIPGFQEAQLNFKKTWGNEAEQKLAKDFQTTAQAIVNQTVNSFKGRILDKEIGMSERMKFGPNDTIANMLGALPSIKTFNEMTKNRLQIAHKLLKQDKSLDRFDAMELADKQVNGDKIRAKVEDELKPKISDADIDFTAKKYGMTKEQVIQRLKSEGKYNG